MDPVRFGRGIRALRRRRGWRQLDLAVAAHVSRATVARVELGAAPRLPVATLDRIATALSARVDVRLTWNGEALDRLLDETHSRLVDDLTRELQAHRWEVVPEVSFSIYGERGSIDLLAFHAAAACVLVVEVKSVLPDLQAMLVSIDRKTRLAPRVSTERGWQATTVARLLVVPNDRTVRRRVDAHATTLSTAFPARTVEVRRWLRHPSGSISGLLFASDVHPKNTRHRVQRPNRYSSRDSVTRVSRHEHLSRSP